MSGRGKPVPWARRVRWLVLPEESLPMPAGQMSDSPETSLEAHLLRERVEPAEDGESSVA